MFNCAQLNTVLFKNSEKKCELISSGHYVSFNTKHLKLFHCIYKNAARESLTGSKLKLFQCLMFPLKKSRNR